MFPDVPDSSLKRFVQDPADVDKVHSTVSWLDVDRLVALQNGVAITSNWSGGSTPAVEKRAENGSTVY